MGTNGGDGRHHPRVTSQERRAILQARDGVEAAGSITRRPTPRSYQLVVPPDPVIRITPPPGGLSVIPVRGRAVRGHPTRSSGLDSTRPTNTVWCRVCTDRDHLPAPHRGVPLPDSTTARR